MMEIRENWQFWLGATIYMLPIAYVFTRLITRAVVRTIRKERTNGSENEIETTTRFPR